MRKRIIFLFFFLIIFILYVSGQYSRSTIVVKIMLNSKTSIDELQGFVNKTKGAQIWINSMHKLFVFIEVPKNKANTFYDYAMKNNINFKVVSSSEKNMFVVDFISVRNNPIYQRTGLIDFHSFLTYEDILEYIDLATEKNYSYVNVDKVLVGLSFESRFIYAIEIKQLPKKEKRGLFINCGIISSDWYSIMGCINVINFLLLLDEKEKERILDVFDVYIIPLSNPDGYAYSRAFDPKWKKNRMKIAQTDCRGVNLERNFKDSFLEKPELNVDPCDNEYGGKEGFSEYETKALRKYFLEKRCGINFYLSIITSKNKTLNYVHTPNFKRPKNQEQYDFLLKNIRDILNDETGFLYEIKKYKETFPKSQGSTCEWVYENTLAEFSFQVGIKNSWEGLPLDAPNIKFIEESILLIMQSFAYDARTSELINFY